MEKYKISVVIEKDENGYFAFCPSIQGCYTQGETYEEVLVNVKDAIKLNIEELLSEGKEIDIPEVINLTFVEIAI